MSDEQVKKNARAQRRNGRRTYGYESAFPVAQNREQMSVDGIMREYGLSKREWLAGMALQGILTLEFVKTPADEAYDGMRIADYVARMAVTYADAIIVALQAEETAG